ncbi:MAG: PQQ-binding-like beta-propeller repeat protein [Planctomycetaceae bacterium]
MRRPADLSLRWLRLSVCCIALDTQTGDTVWKTPRPTNFGTTNGDQKKAYGTPIIIDVQGQQQLFSPSAKGAFAYDPHTGDEIWRIRFDQHSIACRPLHENGLLFLSTGFGQAELLAIDPTGHGDVTETHIRWRKTKGMPSKPSPLYVDGLLYLIHDQGVALCLDAATGEEIWKQRLGGNYSSSPVYAEGRIYAFSEEGDATVLATGRAAKVLAQNKLDAGCLASPAIAEWSPRRPFSPARTCIVLTKRTAGDVVVGLGMRLIGLV